MAREFSMLLQRFEIDGDQSNNALQIGIDQRKLICLNTPKQDRRATHRGKVATPALDHLARSASPSPSLGAHQCERLGKREGHRLQCELLWPFFALNKADIGTRSVAASFIPLLG
ncbi:hypothetical protein BGX33_005617 [Mortierella sp. NVP41]|nr:hypothetical protein BGX33_005617 [Mortierella sp. NVP41]